MTLRGQITGGENQDGMERAQGSGVRVLSQQPRCAIGESPTVVRLGEMRRRGRGKQGGEGDQGHLRKRCFRAPRAGLLFETPTTLSSASQPASDRNQWSLQPSQPSTSNFAMIPPGARTMKPFDINNMNVVDLTGDSDEEDTMDADRLLDTPFHAPQRASAAALSILVR
ncbi:hypothetical protein D8B26_005392 [Coccidioides posadasii str. Silveira]|uniref:uncharacterized protein n=1 Tax=Coccidioides posadasii (strain RMSCC 757 / Silveira) TaxID=443226 RepID=UPI001BF172D6|nr:hypothetical protein D8B26_005392 [Coccidioides posadasii str. Silveira]